MQNSSQITNIQICRRQSHRSLNRVKSSLQNPKHLQSIPTYSQPLLMLKPQHLALLSLLLLLMMMMMMMML